MPDEKEEEKIEKTEKKETAKVVKKEVKNKESNPIIAGDQKQERMWAMICHLSALVNFVVWIPAANILGPLIVWAWKKGEIPSVDSHGKEAMNFQISLMIYALVASLLCFVLIGFILLPIIGIGGIVLVIIAAVKANNGEEFKYPYTIRLIK